MILKKLTLHTASSSSTMKGQVTESQSAISPTFTGHDLVLVSCDSAARTDAGAAFGARVNIGQGIGGSYPFGLGPVLGLFAQAHVELELFDAEMNVVKSNSFTLNKGPNSFSSIHGVVLIVRPDNDPSADLEDAPVPPTNPDIDGSIIYQINDDVFSSGLVRITVHGNATGGLGVGQLLAGQSGSNSNGYSIGNLKGVGWNYKGNGVLEFNIPFTLEVFTDKQLNLSTGEIA